MSNLRNQLNEDMKTAMRNKDKDRLATVRLAIAACKQIEVDERKELSDNDVLQIIQKMIKQRKDAAQQYADAGRSELADKENAEIVVLQDYLPAQLSESELAEILNATITETGASSMADMGAVMNALRPKVQGRTDMGQLSQLVKAKLG